MEPVHLPALVAGVRSVVRPVLRFGGPQTVHRRACAAKGGTGVDLTLLPEGVRALGIDLCRLRIALAQFDLPAGERQFLPCLRQHRRTEVDPGSLDAAILHLVLSVVPDGVACFREAMRALRPGGRIVIFDKFLPEAGSLTIGRRLMNILTMLIGTDITRRLSDLTAGTGGRILSDEPALLGGAYWIVPVEQTV
jgi:phosphatidylethanolamine/phosphatidyl-N-methylethanolamine N-methyltransferase